jgi:hypothetical protein
MVAKDIVQGPENTNSQNNHYTSQVYMRPFTILDTKKEVWFGGMLKRKEEFIQLVTKRSITKIFSEMNDDHRQLENEQAVQQAEQAYGKLITGKSVQEITESTEFMYVARDLLSSMLMRHPIYRSDAVARGMTPIKHTRLLRRALYRMKPFWVRTSPENPIITNDFGFVISCTYANGIPPQIASNLMINPDAVIAMPIRPDLYVVFIHDFGFEAYGLTMNKFIGVDSDNVNTDLAKFACNGIISPDEHMVRRYMHLVNRRGTNYSEITELTKQYLEKWEASVKNDMEEDTDSYFYRH